MSSSVGITYAHIRYFYEIKSRLFTRSVKLIDVNLKKEKNYEPAISIVANKQNSTFTRAFTSKLIGLNQIFYGFGNSTIILVRYWGKNTAMM